MHPMLQYAQILTLGPILRDPLPTMTLSTVRVASLMMSFIRHRYFVIVESVSLGWLGWYEIGGL